MSSEDPFRPHFGSGQTVTSAATSAAVVISGALGSSMQVRILNTGANIAYVRLFNAASAVDVPAAGIATTADFAIPAGMASIIGRGQLQDRLAHISAAGTTLNIMLGNGR